MENYLLHFLASGAIALLLARSFEDRLLAFLVTATMGVCWEVWQLSSMDPYAPITDTWKDIIANLAGISCAMLVLPSSDSRYRIRKRR
jgi:hypothetical protein